MGSYAAANELMSIRAMARALGGHQLNDRQLLCPGPGHGARDRSLSVHLTGDGGFMVYSHAGDDWMLCMNYVRQRLGLPRWSTSDRRVVVPQPQRIGPSRDDVARIEYARDIWQSAVDPRGTTAERYLRSRALVLGDDHAVLRFHPRCPWRDNAEKLFVPALIVAFKSFVDDAVTAIHRIRVDQQERWPKADRRMLGLVRGAAMKLAPAGEALHIGEGVETCMAARQLGHAPAWALGSAGMIAQFPVLENVACLRILGERDAANARAAKQASWRWRNAGRKVEIMMSNVGSDFNDELMEKIK